jgi:hypothetical protein
MIEVTTSGDQITFVWLVTGNTYSTKSITYNNVVLNNIYVKNYTANTQTGFYISTGDLKFSSKDGKVVGLLRDDYSFKTEFNKLTTMTAQVIGEVDCQTETYKRTT